MPATAGLDTTVYQDAGPGDGFFGGWYKATWDFAVQGGAVGTILLPPFIPNNVVVVGGFFDVITTFVGATNTVSMGLNTATDILAATAIATYGTTGRHAIVPVFTAAASVKMTADRQLLLTLATAAVTAGKMVIWLQTFPSAGA